MNEKNRHLILEHIREAGKKLEGKLPPSVKHPKGRNPYAHIPQVIKSVFGCSYTELPDEDVDRVLEIIDLVERYPF